MDAVDCICENICNGNHCNLVDFLFLRQLDGIQNQQLLDCGFSILSIAGPLRTPCVQQASTSIAPLSISALAAFVMVPAVSIISSSRITFLPLMSPMIFITSLTFAFGLRLSIIAIGIFSFSANFLTLVTLPRSGETATKSLSRESPNF